MNDSRKKTALYTVDKQRSGNSRKDGIYVWSESLKAGGDVTITVWGATALSL
jgi:hypothetical protein